MRIATGDAGTLASDRRGDRGSGADRRGVPRTLCNADIATMMIFIPHVQADDAAKLSAVGARTEQRRDLSVDPERVTAR